MGAVSSCCSAESAENKETIGGQAAGGSSETQGNSRGKEGSIKSGTGTMERASELAEAPRAPAAIKTVSDVSLSRFPEHEALQLCSDAKFRRRLCYTYRIRDPLHNRLIQHSFTRVSLDRSRSFPEATRAIDGRNSFASCK